MKEWVKNFKYEKCEIESVIYNDVFWFEEIILRMYF